jgi:hypothetical protein
LRRISWEFERQTGEKGIKKQEQRDKDKGSRTKGQGSR